MAQSVPPATTNTSAPDSIGPRELQNFNLNGTVTRQADTPPAAPPARPQARPAAPSPEPDRTAAAANGTRPGVAPRRPSAPGAAPEARPAAGPVAGLGLPPAAPATSAVRASVPEAGFSPVPEASPASLAPDAGPALWPWLLLAAVLGAGAAFLLLRRRSREAVAGGPGIDAFAAPEPVAPAGPAPLPDPSAAPEAGPVPPKPAGVVSSRLRPWLEIAFLPVGCTVDDDRVTVEFQVQLINSGGAPARDVLVEASMFNAGPTQEQDIAAFFANPVGQGERIEVVPPLQNVTIQTSLIAPRANIQIFELGGRQVFVPLVAFNALYRLGSGSAQTSAAYLLGRETKGDKLGPLRVDLGARAFADLAVRPLPLAVRS